MLMTINEILDALEIRGVVRHYNADRAVAYYGAIWLDDTLPACGANYLYIGRTSRLPAELPGRDIGLLLVNDDGRDLSWMGVDVAELSPDSDIAEICLRVKERFFRTREISAISQSLIEKMFRSQSIREITDGAGADVVIEAVGSPATYVSAIDAVSFTGRVVCIGYAKSEIAFQTKYFVQKELDIRGSRNAMPDDFRAVIRYLQGTEVPLDRLVSGVVSPEEAKDAMEKWAAAPGKVFRILVKWP